MSDTKTPERIWAEFDKMYPEQNGGAWWGEPCNATEYVRAARLAEVEAERDALRGALEQIAERHIPDQPAASGGDELDWAIRQHGALRAIARAALTATPAAPVTTRHGTGVYAVSFTPEAAQEATDRIKAQLRAGWDVGDA